MVFDPEFADMMPDVVTYEAALSASGAGDRTYDVDHPQFVSCRVQSKVTVINNAQGIQVASKTMVLCAPTDSNGAPFSPDNAGRLTLPAGNSPSQPPIIAVDAVNDADGPHHVVVYL